MRQGLSVSLTVLLVAGCAWAQRRSMPAPRSWNPGPSAPGIASGMRLQGQTLHPRSFGFSTPSYFRENRSGYYFYPGRFHHRSRSGFGYGYSPFSYGGYAGYGFPYSYGPYFGAPYGSYDQAPDGCDTRFSSLPYNCVPLYPQGPPSFEPSDGSTWQVPQGESPVAAGPPALEPSPYVSVQRGPSSFPGYDSRKVILTFDGRRQSSATTGTPLVITSGRHELRVAPGKTE